MPKMRSHLETDWQRLKHRFKVYMWLVTFIIWGVVGVGAVFLLAKTLELWLVKPG